MQFSDTVLQARSKSQQIGEQKKGKILMIVLEQLKFSQCKMDRKLKARIKNMWKAYWILVNAGRSE